MVPSTTTDRGAAGAAPGPRRRDGYGHRGRAAARLGPGSLGAPAAPGKTSSRPSPFHRATSTRLPADRPWINHEWLTEALLASAHRLGGTVALAILTARARCWPRIGDRPVVGPSRRRARLAPGGADRRGVPARASRHSTQTLRPAGDLGAAVRRAAGAHARARPRTASTGSGSAGPVPGVGQPARRLGHGREASLAIWTLVRPLRRLSHRARLALLGAGAVSAAATLVNPYGVNLLALPFLKPCVSNAATSSSGDRCGARRSCFCRGRRRWRLRSWRSARSLARAPGVFRRLPVSRRRLVSGDPAGAVLLAVRPAAAGTACCAAATSGRARAASTRRDGPVPSLIWMICVAASTIGQPRDRLPARRAARSSSMNRRPRFFAENRAAGRLVVWFDWGEHASVAFRPGTQGLDGRAPRNRLLGRRCCARTTTFYRNRSGAREFLERLSPDYVLAAQIASGQRDDRGLGLDADLRDRDVDRLGARPSPRRTGARRRR